MRVLKEKIPIWRLLFWVMVAMVGVAYVAHPESETQRYELWGFIAFVGVVMTGFGLILNWTHTKQAATWVREHPRTFRVGLALSILVVALLELWDMFSRK